MGKNRNDSQLSDDPILHYSNTPMFLYSNTPALDYSNIEYRFLISRRNFLWKAPI